MIDRKESGRYYLGMNNTNTTWTSPTTGQQITVRDTRPESDKQADRDRLASYCMTTGYSTEDVLRLMNK